VPEEVQDVFGSALLDAQYGDHPEGARPFGEGVPRGVMKLVEDFDRDTYRAAYTVSFPKAVYVLHVFKKKSTRGVSTPRPDKELITEPASGRRRALPRNIRSPERGPLRGCVP
jgi:phage-related protein